MGVSTRLLKSVVTAFSLGLLAGPALAQDHRLDDLFTALQGADAEDAAPIEAKIWEEWSKSGSPAMDLLLARGREAMVAGDLPLAIERFGALIDHAPDFAEGYNARATAYFNAGRYGESLDDLRMVLALNPRHFGALSGLATILEDLGYDKEALEAWRRVEALNPHQENLGTHVQKLERSVEGRDL